MVSTGSGILSCVGSGGVKNEFQYSFDMQELPHTIWRFRVTKDGVNDFFELVLKELDQNTVMVVFIGNHGVAEFSRKGIAGALLQVARRKIDRVIESSPKKGATGDVSRSEDAENVWKRLVSYGIAVYDNSRDIYMLR